MVVVPAVRPVTTPVALTVAIPGRALLHTPPVVPVGSLHVVVVAGQRDKVPVMAPATGLGSTVTSAVAATVPQLFVTV